MSTSRLNESAFNERRANSNQKFLTIKINQIKSFQNPRRYRNLIKKKKKKIRHPDVRKKKSRAKLDSTREKKKRNTIREILEKRTEEERMDQVAADDAVPNDWTKRAGKSEVGGRCQAKKEDASRVEEAPPDFQRRPQISLFFPANVRFLSPPSLSRRPPLLGRNFSRFTISFARASRSIVTSH